VKSSAVAARLCLFAIVLRPHMLWQAQLRRPAACNFSKRVHVVKPLLHVCVCACVWITQGPGALSPITSAPSCNQ
jgi:hypothetical protein